MRINTKYKVWECCSVDETRPGILNPYLKGSVLYATDGRTLVEIPVEGTNGDADGMIPIAALKHAFEMAGDVAEECEQCGQFVSDGLATLICEPDFVQCADGVRFPRKTIEFGIKDTIGFPPVTQSLDKTASIYRVALNTKLLRQMAEAIGSDTVVLTFRDAEASIGVKSTREDIFGMLMPCRHDLPAWPKV